MDEGKVKDACDAWLTWVTGSWATAVAARPALERYLTRWEALTGEERVLLSVLCGRKSLR